MKSRPLSGRWLPLLLGCLLAIHPLSARDAIWPEVFLPGYNAFRNESYISGSLLLVGRVLTFYAAYRFHNRSIDYRSAAQAASIADLYYGPGLRYKDPYSSDYLSTQEFENRAGRAQNYMYLSIALHGGLMAAGLYQGHRIQERLQEENLQRLEIQSNDLRSTGFAWSWNVDFQRPL